MLSLVCDKNSAVSHAIRRVIDKERLTVCINTHICNSRTVNNFVTGYGKLADISTYHETRFTAVRNRDVPTVVGDGNTVRERRGDRLRAAEPDHERAFGLHGRNSDLYDRERFDSIQAKRYRGCPPFQGYGITSQ